MADDQALERCLMISQELLFAMWNPFKFKWRKKEEDIGDDMGEDVISESIEEENEEKKEEVEKPIIEIEEDKIIEPPFEPIDDGVTRKLKKILRVILLAVIALMPVFVLPFTIPGDILTIPKQLLIYTAAFLGLALWLIITVRQGGVVVKRSGLEIGIGALLLAWLLASIFSLQVFESFESPYGFITLGSLAIIFMLVVNFFEKKDIPKIANYFFLGSFLALLLAVLPLYNLPVFKFLTVFQKGLTINSQFNTVGTLNALGALAVVSSMFLTSTFLFEAIKIEDGMPGEPKAESGPDSYPLFGKLRKWFWIIVKTGLALLSVLVILIVNWWVYFLAISLGVLVMIFAPGFIRVISRKKISLQTLNIIGPLVILVVALLFIAGGKYVNIDFPAKKNITPGVVLAKDISFQIVKGTIDKRPMFGYGLGNFHIAYDSNRPQSVNSGNFWNYRFTDGGSELLNMTVTGGIVFLAGFLTFLYYLIYGSSRILRRSHDFDGGYFLWMVMPVFISMLVIFGMTNFNILLVSIFWILAALIGLSSKQEEKTFKARINSSSLPSVLSSLVFILVFAAALVGGYLVFQKYSAEIKFAQASRLDLAKKENIDTAIDLLTSAQNMGNGDIRYLEGLSQLLVGKIDAEMKNKTDKQDVVTARLQSLTKSTVDVANLITQKYGNDPRSWTDSGTIYQNLDSILNGALDVAAKSFAEYIKKAPNDPNGYMRLASLYLSVAEQNNAALAEAKARKLTIKNEKEVVAKIINDYKKAEEMFKKTAELKPDLAQIYYSLGIIYERQNRLADAIKQLEILKGAQANNATLAFELGLLYYRNGQKDNAFTEMARAVNLFKDYSNARWYLALMLEERGRMTDAINVLKEILKLDVNKDNPIVIQKIASLEAGQREIPPAKVTSKKPL